MILIQRKRIQKPGTVQSINRGLAENTGTIWLSFANSGLLLHDVIGGYNISSPGTVLGGDGGPVIAYSGAQQTNLALPKFGASNYGDDLVICGRIMATAAQAGTPGAAFGVYASTGSQHGIGIGFDPSNNVGAAGLLSAGAFLDARSAGSLNRWYTIFARQITTGGINPTYYAWIDGAPATTTAANRTGSGGAFNEIAVGAQHRSSGFLRNFTGRIAWASVLRIPTGVFGDAEARELYRSGYPYNLVSQRIWVPVTTSTGPNTYTFSVSGGLSFAGTAPNLRTRAIIPSGGVTFGGTAPITDTNEYIFGVSGGVTFSGEAPLIKENVIVPSGGVTLNGTARLIFVPAGGTGSNNPSRISTGVSRIIGLS